jgi:hypothetical protein
MNAAIRNRVRAKQDRILAVCAQRGIEDDTQVSEAFAGSPTVGQLRHCIWPQFEAALDYALNSLGIDWKEKSP